MVCACGHFNVSNEGAIVWSLTKGGLTGEDLVFNVTSVPEPGTYVARWLLCVGVSYNSPPTIVISCRVIFHRGLYIIKVWGTSGERCPFFVFG